MKITVSQLKARISSLARRAGPIIGLVGALVVGISSPSAFENDYFILLILFYGILWSLMYDGDPLQSDVPITVSRKILPAKAPVTLARCKAAWKAAWEKN